MKEIKRKLRRDRLTRLFNIRRNNIKEENKFTFSLKNGI